MILLDTNVISALMMPEPDPVVASWLAAQDPADLALTTVTRAEIRYGLARLPEGARRERLRLAAERFFDSQQERTMPFDVAAADAYGEIVAARERLGRPIGVLDAQIAAIARVRLARVATRDEGGFGDTGVDIVNPFLR